MALVLFKREGLVLIWCLVLNQKVEEVGLYIAAVECRQCCLKTVLSHHYKISTKRKKIWQRGYKVN